MMVLLQLVGFILTERCGTDWIAWSVARSENGYIRFLFGVTSWSVASEVVFLTGTSCLVDETVDV